MSREQVIVEAAAIQGSAGANLGFVSPLGIFAGKSRSAGRSSSRGDAGTGCYRAGGRSGAARSIAAPSAPNSCTSRIASGGSGCRSAWNRKRPSPIARASSNCLIRAEVFEQVLADALSGHEALFARRRSGAASAARRDSERGVGTGRGKGHAGDEPSRTAERDGAHRGPAGGGGFRAI